MSAMARSLGVTDDGNKTDDVNPAASFGCYQMRKNGLFKTGGNKQKGGDRNEDSTNSLFLSGPFELLGRARKPGGEGWARLLRWRDDDNRVHDYPVLDADLHGEHSALSANLASRGLKVSTNRTARAELINYLNEISVEQRVSLVGRTGWNEVNHKKVFALPTETIGFAANETIIIQGANSAPFATQGTLADWQNGVGSVVAGHCRGTFAVSVGLAGPLLDLLGHEGCGFNLYGHSSRGKTTLAKAAASVWGKGESPGFVRSWRSTGNALEATAALHTDTLLVLDELSVVDAREAFAAVYQLTGGTGKGRAARNGSLRQPLTWRTMLLSTGEVRLADKLGEGRLRARSGQQVRLIDIPADAGAGCGVFDNAGSAGDAKALAEAIKIAAQGNYGTAGPAFVRRLVADCDDEIADTIRATIDAFRHRCAPTEADAQVLRVCDRFGLVAAAGELAREFGIVPWKEGDALEAATRCFNNWFDNRGGKEAGEVQAAISQVRLFVEQHGDARFEPLHQTPDRPIVNRAGWRKGEGAKRGWLVPPETWKAEVAVGHNPTFVAEMLAEREMLKRAKDGFQCVEKIQGRSQRVYVVTESSRSQPMSSAAARVLELFLQPSKTGVTGVTHVTRHSVTPKSRAVTTVTPVTCLKHQRRETAVTSEGSGRIHFEERAAIVEYDGGAPREWAEGFARLNPNQPPADVPPHRWLRFIDDCGHFLDGGPRAQQRSVGGRSICSAAIGSAHSPAWNMRACFGF